MVISLFKHNQEAYEALAAMLENRGKACVIHPTGTGKSFIGFRYCEDHPGERVLWLSPSEYIFKTQKENLLACGSQTPDNIRFCTYAKLALMQEEEMSVLVPDTILLDEFHRAGAPIWQQGLMRLLAMYPGVKLIGLTATSVRYLDSQRDMARELFDGCVASEMTLGEALVRGILNPPQYVTALYACRADLERYEQRVYRMGTKQPGRDAAEKYLDSLRRALEQAEGLDEIFQKYITEKSGKYLVFCANCEHMREMLEKLPEHFGAIDPAPHVYQAYYSDAGSDKAFQAFKEDCSDHLKLLYCIDMLNEGVHVDDISGVILFRPTVSPIIYKQQIGRALCAGKRKSAVILDVVNNFSNLYSISAVQEEMDEAVEIMRQYGDETEIVNERFRVIDELRDCRRLFDELESTLSASWDTVYAWAKQYYEENGDLLVPASYVTEDGCQLGQWIITQRTKHTQGLMSAARIHRLEVIGMDWRKRDERLWDMSFERAERYFIEHGCLAVTRREDAKLHDWLDYQRQKYCEGLLPEEQQKRLETIGMIWETADAWSIRLAEARRYSEIYGNLDVPADYETETGIKLGAWIREMRKLYRQGALSEERAAQLEALGMEWGPAKERIWKKNYAAAKKYREEHGDLNVPARFITEDSVPLGTWISTQRAAYKKSQLDEEQIRLLEQIDMSWNRYGSRWEDGYAFAEAYRKMAGNINVSASYVTPEGFRLGAWIAAQRGKYRNGKLSKDKIRRLQELGITWNQELTSWQDAYEIAKQYYIVRGSLQMPAGYVCDDGFRLGQWVARQRFLRRRQQLNNEKIHLLDQIGMPWEAQNSAASMRGTGVAGRAAL